MLDIRERVERLRAELKNLEEEYYAGKQPTADDVYDYKLRELASLERKNPELISSDSPTQRVGFYGSSSMDVDHELPMLSLSNCFNGEDLEAFFKHCEESNADVIPEYSLEPKIDGVSISLIYENGSLKMAISRGDGERGEEMTQKMLHIEDIPIRIQSRERIVVRGEIYVNKSDFKRAQEERFFANPRNYVSGTLRLKEANKIQGKGLRVCIYQILYPERYGLKSQQQILETIGKWGFRTHEKAVILRDKAQIYDYIEQFGKIKESLDIPTDGLVLKVNQLSLLDEIGYTSKFPKWATAYKYPSQVKEARLLRIFPTVGRTGRITYAAQVEPVEINGSVVQFATLHNADYIQGLDLRVGDHVGIYKSGEIIPRIIGFNPAKREKDSIKWSPITHCPSCGSPLEEKGEDLKTQYCMEPNCNEKKCAQLSHWCCRDAANIEGLSVQIVTALNKAGFLHEIADLYRLKDHRERIINSDLQIKEKKFNNLVEAIEKSKDQRWENLLFGLGINYIGEKNAEVIGRKYRSIKELFDKTMEEMQQIEGIGAKVAESLFNWLRDNRATVEELMEFGLFKPSNLEKIADSFISGKKVVITGRLNSPRAEFRRLLSHKYGAIVQESISANTDYLIAGVDAGSKLKKAQEKGVEILSEEELLRRLDLTIG